MKNLKNKDMELMSLNVAGWNWRASTEKWEDRLNRICEYIKSKMKNPLLIALQELQLSGGKYLTVLEKHFPDFHIVVPQAYRYQHQPRSVVSVLLINKDLCESFNVRTLTGLGDSLRYNYVHIDTKGLCFRILNVNVPHNCLENSAEWYREEREALRELFIKKIKQTANTYRSEPDLKLIILGDFNALPNDTFIDSLAYAYNRPMIDPVKKQDKDTPTWRDFSTGARSRIDYILYSTGLFNTGVSAKLTMIDDSTISNKLSDHALLIGGISVDFA